MRTRRGVPPVPRRRSTVRCAVGLAGVLGLGVGLGVGVGCSGSDDDADPASGSSPGNSTVVTTAGGPDPGSTVAPTSDTDGTVDGTVEVPASTESPSSPTASTAPGTIPVGGVPGLDDDEVVCRSWSRIAGTFQVVAVAGAFGDGDPIEPARLEVSGAPLVVAARDELVAAWPAELAAEAEAVVEDYLGPFVRRAERAVTELVAAGATEAQLTELAAAWIDALATRSPEDPSLTVEVPADLVGVVEAAAVAFDREVPPIPRDPSLVTDVEVPATEAFLAENCPDRGTLAGTDPVGGP